MNAEIHDLNRRDQIMVDGARWHVTLHYRSHGWSIGDKPRPLDGVLSVSTSTMHFEGHHEFNGHAIPIIFRLQPYSHCRVWRWLRCWYALSHSLSKPIPLTRDNLAWIRQDLDRLMLVIEPGWPADFTLRFMFHDDRDVSAVASAIEQLFVPAIVVDG